MAFLHVYVHQVLKNNHIDLDALAVTEEESNVSPTINLNSYFEQYKGGEKRRRNNQGVMNCMRNINNGWSLKLSF
jgi:hypothetical protein